MAKRSSLAIAGLALLISGVAEATPRGNVLGGRLVERKTGYASVGFADVELGWRVPIRNRIEIGGRLRFHYPAGAFSSSPSPIVTAAALDLRLQLLKGRYLSGSLVASLPLQVGWGTGAAAGIGLLHPGFLVTYAILDVVDFDLGIQFQPDLWFLQNPNPIFVAALPIVIGLSGDISERVNLGFRFEAGPAFGVFGEQRSPFASTANAWARVRAVLGVSFHLDKRRAKVLDSDMPPPIDG